MESFSVYKDRALASLKGNWDKGVIATVIYLVIVGVGSNIFSTLFKPEVGGILSLVWFFVSLPLVWGFYVYFLRLIRKEDVAYGRLFDGYKGNWQRIFSTTALQYIYTFLWALLLIIPGIIKSFSYAMTPYILKDNPELSNNAAIEKSMAMMDGHKMELFLLELSFIGWIILGVITFGIGMLLVEPYMVTTIAHYYEDLKKEYEGIKAEPAPAE
ncbi:MAG: DUF975 family protein [Prevotella sp.]|jgi:uncharacterized membrane protein|nr:DUF975 family protein [Prevotella sp.]